VNPVAPAILSPVFLTNPPKANEDAVEQVDLRSTSNHEKPSDAPAISSWGRPSGLRPGFRPARSFTSAGSTGDLVAGLRPPRSFMQARGGFSMVRRASARPEPYVRSGSTCDLVAGDPPNRVFDRAHDFTLA
jgi:hypothetical protein